jgi:hypothetical protein
MTVFRRLALVSLAGALVLIGLTAPTVAVAGPHGSATSAVAWGPQCDQCPEN